MAILVKVSRIACRPLSPFLRVLEVQVDNPACRLVVPGLRFLQTDDKYLDRVRTAVLLAESHTLRFPIGSGRNLKLPG